MPTTFVKMPPLGESVAEGTIGRWLKQPGDRVERDEPLVEVQTDKVNAEVPSPIAGVLQRILLPEGATVAVTADIAVIGDEALDASQAGTGTGTETESGAAAPPSLPSSPPPPAQPEPLSQAPRFSYDDTAGDSGPTSSAATTAASSDGESEGEGEGESGRGSATERFYTPVVLRLAREHGLDLDSVVGSGLGGRVTRKDVERVIAAGPAQPPREPAPPPSPAPPSAPPVRADAAPAPRRQPQPSGDGTALTPMRRAIADHMTRARAEIPDAWSMVEIDVTSLVRQRAEILPEWQARERFELTFLPFFIKAVLAGLRAVPELNASWSGDRVAVHRTYNLGIAVSVPQGLVVPVLRDADRSSVAGLATSLRELVSKARSGRLGADDLTGATFTVNNPGSLGSVLSQPIVPVGQAGIVTMETIVKRAVVVADDAIAVRSMMSSCLSFDHRILDGAQALQFLRTVKEQLETVRYQVY